MTKTKLRIDVFGTPKIMKDQNVIFFSFAKINALIFYLLLNETASRDEVASMLWGTKSEAVAKKNLRNTVYQANKALGVECIVSPNKTLLMLNPELTIESDISRFIKDPIAELALYQGEFLKGFYLKESEQFELWVTKMRRYYEQQYISACRQKIENDLIYHRTHETERAIRELIALDEFDEENYQLLMRFYQLEQQRGKVIEVYYELANFLDQELSIEPNEETKQLYERVVGYELQTHLHPPVERNTTQFWGRVAEIKELERYYHHVTQKKSFKSLVIVGDTGVGKRTVTRQVLVHLQRKSLIVAAECLAEERDQSLRVWRSIIDQLTPALARHAKVDETLWRKRISQFFPSIQRGSELVEFDRPVNRALLSQLLIEAFQLLASERPLLLLIEDCHWMDQESVELLQSISSHLMNEQIGIILTKQLGTTTSLDQYLHTMSTRDRLQEIVLQPLTLDESIQFIERVVERDVATSVMNRAFEESQGNLFLLSEYCEQLQTSDNFDVLTPKIIAKMSKRMMTLTALEQEIVTIASYFKYHVAIPILVRMVSITEHEMVEHVEQLIKKHFLREEIVDDTPVIVFTKRIFKTFCYLEHSVAKRRMIHEQIAEQVEWLWQKHVSQPQLLLEIAYHYRQAQQLLKALAYEVDYLQYQLKIQHELFPIYSQQDAHSQLDEWLDSVSVHEQLDRLRNQIESFEAMYRGQAAFQKINMKYLYLEGRYFIRNGDYQRGIESIQRVITIAKELNDLDYLQEGYRQIIYYCIQVENVGEMHHYLTLAFDTSIQANNHQAIGILLRLKGLHALMTGELREAEQLMKESIRTFSLTPTLEHKFAINIAAAYDYLAEIQQLQGMFSQALLFHQKAVQLGKEARNEGSLAIFYVGMAVTYFLMERFDDAQQCIDQAEQFYEQTNFYWKKSLLDVLNVLLDLKRGSEDKALQFIQNSTEILERYSSPRDRGLVYYIFAQLRALSDRGFLKNAQLSARLTQPVASYYKEAVAALNEQRDIHVIRWLQKIRAENMVAEN